MAEAKRRLATILSADVAGYPALMADLRERRFDISATFP